MNDREAIERVMDLLANARRKAMIPFFGLEGTVKVYGIDIANLYNKHGSVVTYGIATWPTRMWFELVFYDDFLINDTEWDSLFDLTHVNGVNSTLRIVQKIIERGYSEGNRARVERILGHLPIQPISPKK